MHFVQAKSLLTRENGMNIYRGCLHGCVYCDSRSRCYQFTHPFEDIEVKENAPILPFITDTRENLETILGWCIDAGVRGIICWNMGMTLREGDREYYYKALDRHFPGLSQKYREVYGNSYEVISLRNAELMPYFYERCEKHGILHTPEDCFAYMHELPERYEQMTLF